MPPEISRAAFPPGAYRHTARAGDLGCVDIRAEIPDLHHHQHLRLMDVHCQVGVGVQQGAAYLRADSRGAEREAFVAAPGLHLEGARGEKGFPAR